MQPTSECKYNILLHLYTIYYTLYAYKRPMTIARTAADNSLNSQSSIQHVYTQQTVYEGKKALLLFSAIVLSLAIFMVYRYSKIYSGFLHSCLTCRR
jgi:hypothetical protein